MLFKIGDKAKQTARGANGDMEGKIKTIYKIYPTVYPENGGVLQMIPGDFIIKDKKIYRSNAPNVLVADSIFDNFWFVDSCELVENKCNCSMNQLLICGCTCGGN